MTKDLSTEMRPVVMIEDHECKDITQPMPHRVSRVRGNEYTVGINKLFSRMPKEKVRTVLRRNGGRMSPPNPSTYVKMGV